MTEIASLEAQGYELVGNIGVDAGLCWIGDPCYILHRDKAPESIGKDWGEFCETLFEEDKPLMQSFAFDMGHDGLGVVTSTGFGDGCYPVYAKVIDVPDWGKRIAELRVVFIADEDLVEEVEDAPVDTEVEEVTA